jgi:hypothetical protein
VLLLLLLHLPFIEMGIMDPLSDHCSGAPIKGGMTLRTPHLTTTIDSKDIDMTLWTGAGLFPDLCNRIDILLATLVFFPRVFILHLMTLRAHY